MLSEVFKHERISGMQKNSQPEAIDAEIVLELKENKVKKRYFNKEAEVSMRTLI